MTDYGAFTPGPRDAALPFHRPHLSPGLRTQTSDGGGWMHVSSLAAEISDSFLSRLWQNWRWLCQGRVSLCRSPSYPGGFISKRERTKKRRRGRISKPRRGKERTASCSSVWPRRRRRFGNRGRGRGRRRRTIGTWIGAARWPISITSISICGMRNGVRRSGKPTPRRPLPLWLWLNGHDWAKRQLEKAGIAYQALDNGFRSCSDPAALQRICDRLGADDVQGFFRRWRRRLPSPFSEADFGADTAIRWRFANSKLPTPTCSTGRRQAGCGLKA
jgi:hypothetical protein